MLNITLYRHQDEETAYRDLLQTVAFADEVMYHYKEYTENLRKTDLYGKSLLVTPSQCGDLYRMMERLAPLAGLEELPELFLYEDFYYGINSKGSDKPWIEMSVKTYSDLQEGELIFLIARELCHIRLRHTYTNSMNGELLELLQGNSWITGIETLHETWRAVMYRWSRLSHYSADCFGYAACGSIEAAVSAVRLLVLNSRVLSKQMDLRAFLAQGDRMSEMDEGIHCFAKMDEIMPYAPYRIKQLLALASSERGIAARREANQLLGRAFQ